MLTLQELLNFKSDIFKNSRVKLVRHKDNRKYLELLKSREKLIEYQEEQSRPVFNGCDYIISFLGIERKRSILFGIFKVSGIKKQTDTHYYYDLQQMHEFDYLNDRIVIDWGEGTRSWVQSYHKQTKEITEILPQGYLGTFPGLLEFVLDFEELKRLIDNPEANFDWKNHLSSVNGIYLILDTRDGNQYIGSACGDNGIWQRWVDYAKNITGGNKKLEELYQKDLNCFKHFKYSILQTLPSNITRDEIIKIENLYKQKLGTKAFGLNLN